MSIDAMKQALAALEAGDWYIGQLELLVYTADDTDTHRERAKVQAAITALRAAIEQAQEPIAWLVQYPNKHEFVWGERPQWIAGAIGIEPLYTTPPQRQWQGLTDEERTQFKRLGLVGVEIIEAKLKEKNNG